MRRGRASCDRGKCHARCLRYLRHRASERRKRNRVHFCHRSRQLRMILRTPREKQRVHPIQVCEHSASRARFLGRRKGFAIRLSFMPRRAQFRGGIERSFQVRRFRSTSGNGRVSSSSK